LLAMNSPFDSSLPALSRGTWSLLLPFVQTCWRFWWCCPKKWTFSCQIDRLLTGGWFHGNFPLIFWWHWKAK
jgi:hypothetical protein